MSGHVSSSLAHLVAGTARWRRRFYNAGWLRREQIAAPVISVGALTMGGSGKTPVARWLTEHLQQAYGLKVGLVLRGYGGRLRGRTHRVAPGDHGLDVGDEAAMHARSLPRAVVVRGANKAEAARLALRHGAEVIVLDDGFQHLSLMRDLDIVLLGATDCEPFPQGCGREGHEAMEHAHLLWLHGRDGALPGAAPTGGRPLVISRNRPCALRVAGGIQRVAPSVLRGREVFALAAIAEPQAFLHLLAALGASVVGSCLLADHARIGPRTMARCGDLAGGAVLVCTEKDLFHLAAPPPPNLWALECGVEVMAGAEQLSALLAPLLGVDASC
ncbi:MAG: tetraacyldisaccharide 4'-kinase [Deltaproteobacteria bacterium]|nr:tetraacyldisaccharide 4'-kinase [Deltaproteobacteria bacterium]